MLLAVIAGAGPLAVVLAVPALRHRLIARYRLFQLRHAPPERRREAACELGALGRPTIDACLPEIMSLCADDAILPGQSAELQFFGGQPFGKSAPILHLATGTSRIGASEFFLRFKVLANSDSWSFLVRRRYLGSGQSACNEIHVPTTEGRRVTVDLLVLGGTYSVSLDGGPPIALEPKLVGVVMAGDLGFGLGPVPRPRIDDLWIKVFR